MKDGVIYIYDAKTKEALRTLKHELIDHAFTSNVVKPLVDIINVLIKSREEVYKAKEELLEKLSRNQKKSFETMVLVCSQR